MLARPTPLAILIDPIAVHAAWRDASGALRWEHIAVDAEAGSETRTLSALGELADVLISAGVEGARAAILLDAGLCVAATVDVPSGRRGALSTGWRRELVFAFEEAVPFDAEDLACDFAVTGGRALGVAGRRGELQCWLDALGEQGIAAESVSPTSLVAAAAVAEDLTRFGLVLQQGERTELIRLEAGRPTNWWLVPKGDLACGPWLDGVERLHAPPPLEDDLADAGPAVVADERLAGEALAHLAAERALSHLAGRGRPPVDLCRGGLAAPDRLASLHRPMLCLYVACLVGLLAFAGSLLWAADRADAQAAAARTAQERVYREVHPDSARVPRAVSRQLMAEWRAMQHGAGEDNAPSEVTSSRSALAVLVTLLADWPGAAEGRVETLRLAADGEFEVRGTAPSFAAVGRLASALGASQAVNMQPATTQRTGGEIRYRLVGQIHSPQAAPIPGPAGGQAEANARGREGRTP